MLFRFKKLNPSCIMRIELMLCIPMRIIHFFKLASTYSPVPSPAKYHRPPVS